MSSNVAKVNIVGILDLSPSLHLELGFQTNQLSDLGRSELARDQKGAANERLGGQGGSLQRSQLPGAQVVSPLLHSLLVLGVLSVSKQSLVGVHGLESDTPELLSLGNHRSEVVLLGSSQTALVALGRLEDEQSVGVNVGHNILDGGVSNGGRLGNVNCSRHQRGQRHRVVLELQRGKNHPLVLEQMSQRLLGSGQNQIMLTHGSQRLASESHSDVATLELLDSELLPEPFESLNLDRRDLLLLVGLDHSSQTAHQRAGILQRQVGGVSNGLLGNVSSKHFFVGCCGADEDVDLGIEVYCDKS